MVLNEPARDTFHQLKKAMMSNPVLAYPNPNKEYLLEMDALKLQLELCFSKSNQMEGTILWPTEAECYVNGSQLQ